MEILQETLLLKKFFNQWVWMAKKASCIVSTVFILVQKRAVHFAHPTPQPMVFCTTAHIQSRPSSHPCSVSSFFSHTYFACLFGIYILIFLLCVLTEHLHRMDPTQFPSHSLEKAPFFEKHAGMPRFNGLFAWMWFHGFCKTVNLVQHLSPASGETFDVLFERKLPKADGSPSEMHVINRNVMALLHFYVVCAPDAGAAYRRAKRTKFHEFVALYKAWEEKGVDWRGELRDLLKHWAPEFQRLFTKKRVMSDKDLISYEAMQVDPLLL